MSKTNVTFAAGSIAGLTYADGVADARAEIQRDGWTPEACRLYLSMTTAGDPKVDPRPWKQGFRAEVTRVAEGR